ncbi:MAG: DUF4236 domain-containing protein [Bacteroidales bacterium]|nr:DUF4236 domain-containing protein [Bacteroidales bacterium]
MAWNYRKRIKIAPGLHVNVSKGGISTSVGVRGASMTFGQKGTYVNTGIPGTGFYSRKKIDGHKNASPLVNTQNIDKQRAQNSPSAYVVGIIGCLLAMSLFIFLAVKGTYICFIPAIIFMFLLLSQISEYFYWYGNGENSISKKTPQYLVDAKSAFASCKEDSTKKLILNSFIKCCELADEIEDEEGIVSNLKQKIEIDRKEKYKDILAEHESKLQTARNLIEASQYNADASLNDDSRERFEHICERFETLLTSERIWNIYNKVSNNQTKASAINLVERKEASVYVGVFNFIHSDYDIPVFDDGCYKIYLYPCFIIVAKNTSDFSVYNYDEINISYKSTRFQEKDIRPFDSNLLGTTWTYVNKNGGPDKRFAYNPQLLIFEYGEIKFSCYKNPLKLFSTTFLFSNSKAAENFTGSLEEYNNVVPRNSINSKFDKIILDDIKTENQQEENIRDKDENNKPTILVPILTKERFDLMQTEARSLCGFLKSATRKHEVRKEIDRMMSLTNKDGSPCPLDDKITFTMLMDSYRCYSDLGYKLNSGNAEEIGLLLFANNISSPDFILDYSRLTDYRDKVAPNTRKLFDHFIKNKNNSPIPFGQFFLQHAFQYVDKNLMSQYMVHLYRFASAIAKADGTIDARESEILANLMKAKDLTTDGKPLATIKDTDWTGKTKNTLSGYDPIIEDVAKVIVEKKCISTSFVQRNFCIGYNRASRIIDQLENLGIIKRCEDKLFPQLMVNTIEEVEKIFNATRNPSEVKEDVIQPEIIPSNSQNELQELIGLHLVKEEVNRLINFIKIQQTRKKNGLKTTPISYHCVFTGNPGTGKTTVARIIANIYQDLGILKKGHLVETDRSGLVAEYVGQTAVKTNKIIDSALDGVLFIDEAYSLVQGSNNDYGMEAISTLLKRMEDDRDKLVVILAGYSNEMKDFINSNPGLQSRFNRYIHFIDYSEDELVEIFKLSLSKHEYTIKNEAIDVLHCVIRNAIEHKDKNFGNGRYVRNLFEKTIENQASRLASEPNLTKDTLSEILPDDISTK